MTPHWQERREEIRSQVEARPRVLLACDFDGTLAPIAPRPEEAMLPERTRRLLDQIARSADVVLAFVSGRGLRNLRAHVGIEAAFYCGNHGLEIEGPGIAWSSPEAASRRPEMDSILADLRRETSPLRNVLVEDKGLTATVHWRLASPDVRKRLGPIVADAVRKHPGLWLGEGKAVWELRPRVEWNKGSAVQFLLAHARLEAADTLFLGDDKTDESAFGVLPSGVTLRVGVDGKTAARYRARDPADAAEFLHFLFGGRCPVPE